MGLKECGLNLSRDNKELKPHGTIDFPCAGYSSCYRDSEDDIIPWHWHPELEILYIKSGNLKLKLPEKTFHLTPGDGFIVNSNVLHYAAAEPLCELHSIVFSPLLITGWEGSVFAEKYIGPLVRCPSFDGCSLKCLFPEPEMFENLFTAAFHALAEDLPGYEFTLREALSKLCYALCLRFGPETGEDCPAPSPDAERLRRMLDFIHCHYSEPLKLPQIAEAADIGERECLRCFSRMIQVSPIQYLLKYRVNQSASLLLREPGKNITDIAGGCGFDSPGNFSRIFKRYYKCSPKEYRSRNKE